MKSPNLKKEDNMEDAVELSTPELKEEGQTTESPLNHAIIDMTEVDESTIDSLVSKSIKDEFNPNATQNGLVDEEVEGGVYRYRTTSGNLARGSEGGQIKNTEIDTTSAVTLSGFKALADGYAFDVVAKFPDLKTAKASVNGDKFIYLEGGKMVVADIIDGTPNISDEEKEIARYVSGEWVRP